MVDEVNQKESGQSVVLIALLMVGLMAIVALAIDGGNALNERRVTQNAADASALGGIWYIVKTEGASEQELMSRIHDVVEDHGIPDTDGIPGNEVNDNVTIYYTDHEGNPLIGCNEAPCVELPGNADGLNVVVSESFPTFFAGVIGISDVTVSAEAIAVLLAGNDDIFSQGLSMLALAKPEECSLGDKPIDISGSAEEILGAAHSNSYIDVSGSDNHFHDQLSYVEGWHENGQNNIFVPEDPVSGSPIEPPLPLWGLSVDDFAPGGDAVMTISNTIYYHDVSDLNGNDSVTKADLISAGLYNDSTHALATGVYYAGTKIIDLSDSNLHGEVTLVTHGEIFLSGTAVNLKNFHDNGILVFTDWFKDTGNPIDQCTTPAVTIGGSSNDDPHWKIGNEFEVEEGPLEFRHSEPCPVPGTDDNCWSASDHLYKGLIYAPLGQISTNGSWATYYGGMLAFTLKLAGSNELFVGNPNLFPPTIPYIFLYE